MSNSKPEPQLFALQKLVVDLALIERHHRLIGHERAESDVDHSFAVAMLCWLICDTKNLPLNVEKVLKYALIHDLAEVYAGDVNAFASNAARKQKIKRESAAIKRLGKEFAGFKDLATTLHTYEARTDEEALFVWTVDKMQPVILAELDGWRPYRKPYQPSDITYDMFVKKHNEQLAPGSPYCREIFTALLEYAKTTYYDRPVESSAQ